MRSLSGASMLLLTLNAQAQTPIQNPFWLLTNNPPVMVKHGTLSNQTVNPPFSNPTQNPPPPNNYPQFDVRTTSSNGEFDRCGTSIFYICKDDVFNAQGISIGNLELKDRVFKWNNPSVLWDFPEPTPWLTENFEAPIMKVPGAANAGKYYLLYSDCRPFASALYIATYDSNSGVLLQADNLSPSRYETAAPQFRMAISKPEITGTQYIYLADRLNSVSRIVVSGAGAINEPEEILPPNGEYGPLAPELELSHDGKQLAWAINNGETAMIHVYDMSTEEHITLDFIPILDVHGLEFLPDGRLAVAATWQPGLTSANGVCIFNASFTGLSTVPGTAARATGMIELGANGMLLYANNGSQLAAIQVSTLSLASGYSVTASSSSLSSPFSSSGSWVSGALPDQIDGGFYVDPSTCPSNPGGTNRLIFPIESQPETENEASSDQ
jgi:hypothetical protein